MATVESRPHLDHDPESMVGAALHAMPRRFSLLSLVSMSFALLATWNGFGSAVGISLRESSTAGSIWSFWTAASFMTVVALGMAELSSAFPFAGAQYCWSYAISQPDWAPFASYCCASISTFGWWLGLGATSNFVATTILAIVSLCNEQYVQQPFHTWLLYVAVIWLAIALNIFGSHLMPAFNKTMLYISICSLVVTVIALLACAFPNFAPVKTVLTDIHNDTGLSSTYSFALCIVNATYGFLGLDSGAHMCEEIVYPTTNVPKVIMYSILIGLITTTPFSLTLMFVITDMKKVLHSSTKLPLIEIYYQATGSKVISAGLMTLFALSFFGCVCGNITSSSRQIWSTSRDKCFPMSDRWSQIHHKWQMPANAAYLTGSVVSLYGLVFVWSSDTFTSMVSTAVVFMTLSYVIPQGILLYRGRSMLPPRDFDLGKCGVLINSTACVWVLFVVVISCYPMGVTPQSNSTKGVSKFVVCILLYITITWYLWQRHRFRGPQLRLHAPKGHLYGSSSARYGRRTPHLSSPRDRSPDGRNVEARLPNLRRYQAI